MYENSLIPYTLNKLSVRVSTSYGLQGSGVTYLPANAKDTVFVITAKHCLKEEGSNNLPANTEIQLHFVNDKNEPLLYVLSFQDRILWHPTEDIAVIVLRESIIKSLVGDIPKISLTESNDNELQCLFYGFPLAASDNIATRVNAQILPPITSGSIGLETTLRSETNITEHTVQGFSGSGIGLLCAGNVFLLGVVTRFEEWSRFFGLSISFVNDVLEKYGYNKEPIVLIETDPALINDCNALQQNTRATLGYIDEVISEIHIERKQLIDSAVEKLQKNDVLIITGIAGVGKSTFCKEFLGYLENQESYKLIGFSGSQICKINSVELLKSLNINGAFTDFLKSKSLLGRKVIYIDSAEKSVEAHQMSILKEILLLTKEVADVKVVLSIRSYALTQTTFSIIRELAVKNDKIEVALLSNEELSPVIAKHPYIQSLLSNKSVEQFIRTPFYLKQIIHIGSDITGSGAPINESGLKKILWDKIVCKDNPNRELLFHKIAIERATALTPFVAISMPVDTNLLLELLSDSVIIKHEDEYGIKHYAPSHDIFEDWALVRLVSQKKSTSNDLLSFYRDLGNTYAIRKGFRFWIQELYRNNPASALQLTQDTLNLNTSEHWKDSVIISLLMSSACVGFMHDHKQKLLKDDARLWKRIVHLLRTSCKQLNTKGIETNAFDDREYQVSSSLIPVGDGWIAVLDFIDENFDVLKKNYALISKLMLEWQHALPLARDTGARIAANVVLKLLNEYIETSNEQRKDENSVLAQEILRVFLKLSKVNFSDVEVLINEAQAFLREENEEKDFEKRYANRKLSDLYEKLIDYCLSWLYSEDVARYLPNKIIELATNEWIEKPIEKPPVHEDSIFKHLIIDEDEDTYGRFNSEHYYGLESGTDRDYSPCSAFQTPVFHLLNFNPDIALEFIVEFINKTTITYSQSKQYKRDNAFLVSIELNDGTLVQMHGSDTLWKMHRGTVVMAPDLLKSMLMALEKWMLGLAGQGDSTSRDTLNKAIQYIYKNSNSISLVSVIASISMAYPFIIGENMLPLFSFEEGFIWDIHRLTSETNALSPIDHLWQNPYLQTERYESNKLPHRKDRLEFLALKMSFYEHYHERILGQLDKFYADPKTSTHNRLYEPWAIILNRTDKRRYKVTKEFKDGFIIEPEILEEHREEVEAASRLLNENESINVWAWTNEVLNKDNIVERSWEKWVTFFELCKSEMSKDSMGNKMHNNPAGIAAIGLKYFNDKLSSNERDWCISAVVDACNYFVEQDRNIGNFSFDFEGYSHVNKQPAYESLPSIFQFEFEESDRGYLVNLVVRVLYQTSIHDGLNKPLFEKVCHNLWIYNTDLALTCFRTFIILAQSNVPREQHGEIIAGAVKEPPPIQNYDQFGDEFNCRHFLDKAFLLISEWQQINKEGLDFIKKYQELLVKDTFVEHAQKKWRHNHNQYSDGYLHFQGKYGKLILGNNVDFSVSIFNHFLNFFLVEDNIDLTYLSDESFEFANRCLKYMIWYENEYPSPIKFNDLWKLLLGKTYRSGRLMFIHRILLNDTWNDSSMTWAAIEHDSLTYKTALAILGQYSIESSVKLIAGIGFNPLFPGSISIMIHLTKNVADASWVQNYHAEKFIQRAFYSRADEIRGDTKLRDDFMILLDFMVENGSSIAYLVRDNFISLPIAKLANSHA